MDTYRGVNRQTELPKCLRVSSRALSAILSRYGSAAGESSAANPSAPQSPSRALLTSRSVHEDGSSSSVSESTASIMSEFRHSMLSM